MTTKQYERWKDFALRAAKTWYRRSRRPSAAWVLGEVEAFFGALEWDYRDDIPLMMGWCDSDPYPGREDQYGHAIHPPLLCDFMTALESEGRHGLLVVDCEDDDLYDDRVDRAVEQWESQWRGPVRCCVRAGLDCAMDSGLGVLGISAGEIRAMYPEGVPGWIAKPGEKWITETLAPCSIGMVRTAEPAEDGEFAEMPDGTLLIL